MPELPRPPLTASPDAIREALERNAEERKFLRRLLKLVDGRDPGPAAPEPPQRIAGPAPLELKTSRPGEPR